MVNWMIWINWVDSEWEWVFNYDNDDDGSLFSDDEDDEDACRVSEE